MSQQPLSLKTTVSRLFYKKNTAADAAAANKQKQNIGSNIGQQCALGVAKTAVVESGGREQHE
jgi:hypothetical protein